MQYRDLGVFDSSIVADCKCHTSDQREDWIADDQSVGSEGAKIKGNKVNCTGVGVDFQRTQ